MIALLMFSNRPDLMGRFATGRLTHAAASIGAVVVLTLNGVLILQTFGISLPELSGG
jgi:manganese transport protein